MLDEQGPFSLAKGERDGLPYFLIIRQKFNRFDKKADFHWFLSIEISTKNANEFGLISDDEAGVLNKFEDFLGQEMQGVASIYFIGRLTWNGQRSLFYYVSNPKLISEKLERIMRDHFYPRDFQYEIVKDIDWKKLSELIPNIEDI